MRVKRGKKYQEAAKQIEPGKIYDPKEAFELIGKLAFAKFDETVEAAVRLGVDPRHADQMVRGAVVLPHGTGQEARVLVFEGRQSQRSETQALILWAPKTGRGSQGGWLDFDRAVASRHDGYCRASGAHTGPADHVAEPRTDGYQ